MSPSTNSRARLHHHVGGPGAPLVLAEVLAPRLDDERLEEAIGVGEVAEQPPLLGAAAAPVALDAAHHRRELARGRRRHPVGDTVTSTGPSSAVRLER